MSIASRAKHAKKPTRSTTGRVVAGAPALPYGRPFRFPGSSTVYVRVLPGTVVRLDCVDAFLKTNAARNGKRTRNGNP